MTPAEKIVVRSIIKALRDNDATDMQAYSTSYGVAPRLNGEAGRKLQASELLQALVDGRSR